MSDPTYKESVLQRLKERKLVQWTLGYLAGAWVLLEVFSTMQDGFGWSPSLFPIFFSLLCVGFVVTLVLAWYHGEQGRQRVSGPELLIIAGLLVVAGIGFRVLYDDTGAVLPSMGGGDVAEGAEVTAVLPFNAGGEGVERVWAPGSHRRSDSLPPQRGPDRLHPLRA